ncbi:MAG: acyl-CoA thioesterase, partial [Crocinitomicaceae bacterium]|nr:acyl-CoA thioesterase [Crocinitomicaceae bacterium]
DQMNIVYYGNYAQYFEVGRVEALRSFGMTYKNMEENGVMLPVLDFSVKYISPAYYDDLLTVVTKISGMKGPRLYFDYEIFNEAKKLIAIASTTLVFVSKTDMRPTPPPADFSVLMNQYKID